MARRVRRAFSLLMRAATVGKRRLESELKRFVRGQRVDKRMARKIASALLKEAKTTAKNFASFASQESKRIAKRLAPLMKRQKKGGEKKGRAKKR
ncbi:MAG: hypothetical protein QXU88_00195 [Candidatus Woesearchaeota archaeon]